MTATAAILVMKGVAPRSAVSTDLAPGDTSVATTTGVNVPAIYPPTIRTMPAAKRQPTFEDGPSFSTILGWLPVPMSLCCPTIGRQNVAFMALVFKSPGVNLRLMPCSLPGSKDAFASHIEEGKL